MWDEFQDAPARDAIVDIHCVTKWSKFGTKGNGRACRSTRCSPPLRRGASPAGPFVLAVCDGGYTTTPTTDVTGGKAWVALGMTARRCRPEHGGPARLLVLTVFWKSAKWCVGAPVAN